MDKRYGKVAIIMRTKDRNIFLKRAIGSVINQIYKDWILVIVNDGGNAVEVENLLKNYEQYKDKIIVIHNEESIGMEAASNKGIMSCDSKYIVIHDDDDTWEKDFLSKTVEYLEKNLKIGGVVTHSNKVIEEICEDKIKIKKIKPFNSYLKGSISIWSLCERNLFSPISFIYKREVFDEIGLYDEDFPVLGDWDFNLRFIRKYDIHVIEEKLANYHQRPQIKKGIYSNSIIGGRDQHLHYEIILKNKFLREDLKQNNNYGILFNISNEYNKKNLLHRFIRKIYQKY